MIYDLCNWSKDGVKCESSIQGVWPAEGKTIQSEDMNPLITVVLYMFLTQNNYALYCVAVVCIPGNTLDINNIAPHLSQIDLANIIICTQLFIHAGSFFCQEISPSN